jgi:hypothetical protein
VQCFEEAWHLIVSPALQTPEVRMATIDWMTDRAGRPLALCVAWMFRG